MTHSTPLIMGNPKGAPHSSFIDTQGEPDFDDTQPSMPAPFYGSRTGQHRHLPPPKRRASMLITAIALVGLCAAPFIFFVR